MFGKIFALFIFLFFLYLTFNGILKMLEDKTCRKYYLNNRKNCKFFTCRFHKYCVGKKEKIVENVENENKVLKVKLGENNELDV